VRGQSLYVAPREYFSQREVFIGRGDKIDFTRRLIISNAGGKLNQNCDLLDGETISSEKFDAQLEILRNAPQVKIITTHELHNGRYARTVYLPKGCVLIGLEHKTDHINLVLGDITVTTTDGLRRLTGLHAFPVKAGHRRSGLVHEDTIWTTICQTTKTELSEIEDELVVHPETLYTRRHLLGQPAPFLLEY
jgi:hypothetical protein